MSLVREYRELLAAYLSDARALDEVRDWLVEYAQAIVDTNDECLNRLTGRTWILLSELDADHISEDDVAGALSEAVASERQIPA